MNPKADKFDVRPEGMRVRWKVGLWVVVMAMLPMGRCAEAQEYFWSNFARTPGTPGSVDGIGGAAQFGPTNGVALDGSGNIYVADWGNNTVRKVTPGGAVTTVAGTPDFSGTQDGVGSAAGFLYPESLVVSASGIIYVSDSHHERIVAGTSRDWEMAFASEGRGE
jgi:sugar lactone lactonase YvrE